MSPKNRKIDAAHAVPRAEEIDSHNNAVDGRVMEEKSRVPETTQDKMMALLVDLSERMVRMESSQSEQKDHQRKDSMESSVFGSAVGKGMTLQALEHTPPQKRNPDISPATYFGMRQPAHIGAGGHKHAQGAADPRMGNLPERGFPQRGPAGHYAGAYTPNVGYAGPGHLMTGVPDSRQRKLGILPFDGKELYQGLGSVFMEWGKDFVRQLQFAERASGFTWNEDIKVDVLGQHLSGMAQKYYRRQVEAWWIESPTLEHAMQRLLQTFATKITPAQSMKLFTALKSPQRNWTEHYLYLTAVSDACGGAESLVLDNIVHYADPSMRMTMLSRLDIHRIDYLRRAEELAHFARSTEIEVRDRNFGRDVVNTVESRTKVEGQPKKGVAERASKKCFKCGHKGHVKASCPRVKKHDHEMDFTLTVGDKLQGFNNLWILDRGSSRHLVNDLSLLDDPVDFHGECMTAASDRSSIKITKQGTAVIKVKALGVMKTIRLTDVHYAKNLERNIISYGILEQKGCALETRQGTRVLVSCVGGAPVMDVDRINNVLIVEVFDKRHDVSSDDAVMAALENAENEPGSDIQSGSLMHFHRRFGHLCCDTIIKMAQDSASGIKLTDTKRAKCLACARGKQTKCKQSKVDRGINSPIDVVGGVICSDLKGPMTPRDRLGNRYMVNFIDHRSNYCRVFLEKTKDVAAMKFKEFLTLFERKFNCRIHVLRTDGGGEYKTLDMFCKSTGVTRQVSEANNQASNGKAERMHRTIMNMVQSIGV